MNTVVGVYNEQKKYLMIIFSAAGPLKTMLD